MLHEGFAGLAGLASVTGRRKVVGAGDEVEIGLLVSRSRLDEQHLQLQVIAGLFQ